jgi:transcriptional regulator with XRE-family HTH domain
MHKYDKSEPTYKTALGTRIRIARGTMPQAHLGKILGVPKSRISEWEHGKWEPRAETLVRIAKVTGCEVAWLVAGVATAEAHVPDVKEAHILPNGVRLEAWQALLPLLPQLSAIYAARDIPEHAERWKWTEGIIKTLFERVAPDVEALRKRQGRGRRGR